MLKRACSDDLQHIRSFCGENGILGCKALCQVLAYGFNRAFLEVWIMRQEEAVVAVITKFYDDVTLIADEDCDIELLETFLSMFSYNSVALSEDIAIKLGYKDFTVKNGYRFEGIITEYSTSHLTEDDIADAYDLISHEIPGSFRKDRDSYLSFLSDFTFRQRRSLARGVCTHFENKIASVAITSSETDESAIISGVACDSRLQKRGLGKRTVLSIVNQLVNEDKKTYVIALNESAEGFYEHIGFIKTESIAFIEREKDV